MRPNRTAGHTILMVIDLSHAEFLAVAEEAIVILKKLSGIYPDLVSPYVESAVENWENRISRGTETKKLAADLEGAEEEALSRLATELIATHQMEDVLQLLSEEFEVSIDYQRLISLIGKDEYLNALRREAGELESNAISPEQMAELWNSLGKPVLGGARWTASEIASITQSTGTGTHK